MTLDPLAIIQDGDYVEVSSSANAGRPTLKDFPAVVTGECSRWGNCFVDVFLLNLKRLRTDSKVIFKLMLYLIAKSLWGNSEEMIK